MPRDVDPAAWRARLNGISEVLARARRTVDPKCADETLEKLVEEMTKVSERLDLIHAAGRYTERTIPSTPAFSPSGKFVQAQITSTRSFGKVWDKLLGDGL